MPQTLLYRFVRWAPLCALLGHGSAHAAPEPVAAPSFASEPVPVFAVLDAVQGADARFGVAARSDKLDAQRGGTDTVNNQMQLDGGVHDNVANHVVTGANSIDSGSFANMAGIPTVIQNSGANVLIQNATIINLQFK
ncbi:hypothetical protein [Massilia sp. S19_KUP03_FR1]|uniref:hypothetical protein n=1 Tax=Massilia sp. S19_KUP03_FR1 TaxID=3025503 RepID=UPI002FCDA89B